MSIYNHVANGHVNILLSKRSRPPSSKSLPIEGYQGANERDNLRPFSRVNQINLEKLIFYLAFQSNIAKTKAMGDLQ